MKISQIRVFKTDLPYVGGIYGWGAGNAISAAKATVIVIECGVSGCGEFTPYGENYMVAHSEVVAATNKFLVLHLIGQDPRQIEMIGAKMDRAVQGHGYAKSPMIAACHDILGKYTDLPVWMLLGGKLTDGAPMYRGAPPEIGRSNDTRNGSAPCIRVPAVLDQGWRRLAC